MKCVWSYRTSVQNRPLHQHPPVLQMRKCFHLGVQFPWGKKFQHELLHISLPCYFSSVGSGLVVRNRLSSIGWCGSDCPHSDPPGPVVVDLYVRGHVIRLSTELGGKHMLPVAGRILGAADLLLNTLPVWDLGFLLFFPSLSVWTTPAPSLLLVTLQSRYCVGWWKRCVIDGVPSVTLAASTHSNPPTLFTLRWEAAFTLLPWLALPFRLGCFFFKNLCPLQLKFLSVKALKVGLRPPLPYLQK